MRIKRLPHKKHFINQLQEALLITLSIVIFSLILGTLGYMYFFKIQWDDALYNASMILTGMGPVAPANTTAAKLFGSFYALYSGVAVLTSNIGDDDAYLSPVYSQDSFKYVRAR